MEENQSGEWVRSAALTDSAPDKAQLKVIHATIKKVGEAMFGGPYLLPFEVVSALLTVAVVGAVVLGKKEI